MGNFTVLNLLDLEPEPPNTLQLRCMCGRKGLVREVISADINRPGLALAGFFNQFAGERIQVIGQGEYAYIQNLSPDKLSESLKRIQEYPIPCFIFCYNLDPPEPFRQAAEEAGIPLLLTPLDSSSLSIRLLRALDDVFAPQQTVHGVMVEVQGMGVLIQGESGIGKSETALELLDRGHRLIADDSVRIKCLHGNTLWGYGLGNALGYHMEIRGLGIIDVSHVYGLNAIIDSKQIELVFQLEEWDNRKNYNRLGTSEEKLTLLNVSIPLITIPVKPGRNIPVLIEAAVMNQHLKRKGLNAARNFNQKLIRRNNSDSARNIWYSQENYRQEGA